MSCPNCAQLRAALERTEPFVRGAGCYSDVRAALAATNQPPAEPAPIPLPLFCPVCRAQHVDRDEWATPAKAHHKHLCEGCGHVWDVGIISVGVEVKP